MCCGDLRLDKSYNIRIHHTTAKNVEFNNTGITELDFLFLEIDLDFCLCAKQFQYALRFKLDQSQILIHFNEANTLLDSFPNDELFCNLCLSKMATATPPTC